MTKMLVDISTKYDKMLGHIKAEQGKSKAAVVARIVELFFQKDMKYE
jgi:hypothetical protein